MKSAREKIARMGTERESPKGPDGKAPATRIHHDRGKLLLKSEKVRVFWNNLVHQPIDSLRR